MYSEIARKNKHFKKRQHLLNDDPAYLYDDDSEDMEENLIKKSEFTEVTPERFAAWMIAFRAEQKIKQDRDPVFQRKKMMLAKPSGRDIFSDKTKDFVTYYDDEKNEDDDEAVDLKREKDEMVDEDDLEIDEDVFDDEDDLDDEDFIDDEEN